MRPRSVLAVILLATLFASAGLPVAVAGAGTGTPGVDAAEGGAGPFAVSPAADRPRVAPNFTKVDPATVITINVTGQGDARWTVASRFRLENDTQEAAFRAMAADVRNGTGPVATMGYSVGTFRAFAAEAENATVRDDPMNVESPEWTARVDAANDTGVLALSFTWTNFADHQDNGSRIVLGDVFAPDDGEGWFPSLSADQRLVINAPPDYLVRENTLPYPILEGGSIRVDGPANLTAQEVSVVYGPADDGPGDDPTPTPTRTSTPGQGFPPGVVGGGLLLLAVAAVLVGYLLYRRPDDDGTDPGTAPAGGDGGTGAAVDPADAAGDAATGDGGTTAEGSPGDGAGEPTPTTGTTDVATAGADAASEATAGAAAAEDAAADDEAAAEGTGEAAVDPELLSDEERVERLLRENGGRMKQSNIVTETGWSNAKVSQLLSAMDDDDRIDKLRIGRENLIALPEEDVGEIE